MRSRDRRHRQQRPVGKATWAHKPSSARVGDTFYGWSSERPPTTRFAYGSMTTSLTAQRPSGWTHVTTVKQATDLLDTGRVVELSLDHDLGDDERFGRGIEVV